MNLLKENNVTRPLQASSPKQLHGIFTVTDIFNENRRRYPESIFMKAYEELQPKIRGRRLMGELDHPLDYDEIRLSNVSHLITDCTIDEVEGHKAIRGTVELLDTPAGKVAQALVKAGIPLGVSSRSLGDVKRVNEGSEVTALKLITYDLVADPSESRAILSPEQKAELNESFSQIEKRLPLNESVERGSVRDTIQQLRESLSLNETIEQGEDDIDAKDIQIHVLRDLLEQKSLQLKEDSELLITNRKKIKSLEESVTQITSRYDNLRRNNRKLQEEYTSLQESVNERERKLQESKDAEILDLKKRLAVEKRGLDYQRVQHLLESATTDLDIESKLDSISNLSKRKSTMTEEQAISLTEAIVTTPNNSSRLSRIISQI